jgi:RNA polymerase sporulation-specific sigma factor
MNKKIDGVLSPFERTVWQMYLTGNSAKKISAALGKNEKSIENAIFRIKRKLRGIFSENV